MLRNASEWWQELHKAGCIFTTRLKKNARFSFEEWRVPEGDGVLADDVIRMEKGVHVLLWHLANLTKANIFQRKSWENTLKPLDKFNNIINANQMELALC